MPISISGDGSIGSLSATEIGYLDGVTSAVQTQIDSKISSKVIQIVTSSYGIQTTRTAATSWADTGLTATITPTSAANKVLVILNQTGIYKASADILTYVKLIRGATDLSFFELGAAGNGSSTTNWIGGSGTVFLDTPSTTSATVYKTQYSSNGISGTIGVNMNNSLSTICLIEVAS